MALLRAQKESLVENLTTELTNSRVALIFSYTGLNSQANQTLRDRSFEQGGKIRMISNNLLRLVLKKVGRELELPEKTLALAYAFNDEATAAKTLVDFAKETETLEILGGWVDGQFFDTAAVKTLASLPSKETLQAQLVSRLAGLTQSLVYNLNYPLQKFAYIIQALEKKNA